MKVDLLSDVHSFMRDVLTSSKETLSVSRISVWIFTGEEDEQAIECIANTDWDDNDIPQTYPRLYRKDFPTYFKDIEFGVSIAAHNAETDPSTKEFLEPYLKPENIKSMLDTIIFSNGFPIGVVCCEQKSSFRTWSAEEVQFAELVADCCTYRLMARKQAELEAELGKLVFIDDLTQTHNRRYFFESIDKIISLHIREKHPLSIAMVDLDDFKLINDNFGHNIGDKVLKQFSSTIKQTLRVEDLFCRFGGEEFIILFQNQTPQQTANAIERALDLVRQNPVINKGKEYQFTFSAGLTEVVLDEAISESIKRADVALYVAKRNGKNQLYIEH